MGVQVGGLSNGWMATAVHRVLHAWPPRWFPGLGANRRFAETLTGLTLMGVRVYYPHTGRFLSTDPAYGGGHNLCGYPGDPINQYDLMPCP